MCKNKKWKRRAKGMQGNCIRSMNGVIDCDKCKYGYYCTRNVFGVDMEIPIRHSLRKLEKMCRGKN